MAVPVQRQPQKNTQDPIPQANPAVQTPITPTPWDPTTFGREGFRPGYDSNQKGSFEGNFNNILNGFSPDELLKRYETADKSQLNTPADQLNYQAYQSFKSLIGRTPTANEFAEAIPAFQAGPQIGNAWLATRADALKKTPEALAAGSGKYKDQVNQVFQSQLGRAATADEVTHFGSLLGTGNLDSYGLQNFLTGTPEYQKQQDTAFQKDLGGQLETSDVNYFNRAKNGLMSQFAQNGQTFGNSSALDSALADLMGQIQQKRSDYMANLTAQQYGGNKQLALSNYGNTMDQYLQGQNYDKTLNQRQQDQFAGRANELTDYNTQKNDYMNFLGSQKSGGANPLYGAVGTLGGAAFGGAAGGYQGAQLGATLGAVGGNSYGYLSR